MKIRFPKIRIEVPSVVRDLERVARQVGLSRPIEEAAVQSAARELAGGSLLAWQLRTMARICNRAAEIKEAEGARL
jgi:hypothetical protein